MEEYTKYPIYRFTAWVKDRIKGSEHEQAMTVERMFKEEKSKDELDFLFDEFKMAIANRKDWTIELKDEDTNKSEFIKMTAKEAGLFVTKEELTYEPRYESWVLTWFSHHTIDNGEDDNYFYNSFSDYVRRMKRYNSENGQTKTFKSGGTYWDEPVCLMGAEDTWRWHSWTYDEGFDKENPDTNKIHRSDSVPCRCIYCKEQGIVQINH